MYIFWFLHQTTTILLIIHYDIGCISFDSYIKPQLAAISIGIASVVYLLIPTSNHNLYLIIIKTWKLYIFWFLHQTTTGNFPLMHYDSCISFDSYIKPQPFGVFLFVSKVVYLLIPTSNHNRGRIVLNKMLLYIFWFLHQTTTIVMSAVFSALLYIFWFLHQTTTLSWFLIFKMSCISFDSYIKPQRRMVHTSLSAGCISFDSYIKPQLAADTVIKEAVVYLLIPTSNHNAAGWLLCFCLLYIFWFLHQTTTPVES